MATKPKVGQIAATKPRFEYVDVDRSQLTGARFYDDSPVVAETEAPEAPGMLRRIGDTAVQFGQGAVTGVKMMSDIFGANNAVSSGLSDVNQALDGLLSATAQGDKQKVAQIMQEAEGKGWGEQIVAGLKAAGVDPVGLAANALGTSLPTMATMLIPGAGPAAVAARMGAGVAMGAGQGVGAVKGQIYDETKRKWLEARATPEQAEAKAQEAAAYGGENTDQIAIGGVLGMGSVLGAERALGKVLHGASKAGPGMLGRVATSTLAETGTEMLQGGQEKFATNTALNRQGFDVDPMSGVIANATLEGAAASFMGAAAGIPKPAVATAPGIDPAKEAADTIRATEKVPESGPMTRATNAATEAKAQAIEAGAPLVDEQAAAEPVPVDDPVRDQILALPEGARQDALRAYAVVNRTDVAKGVLQYNRKLLDRLLAENAPPPVLGERLTDTDMGSMLGGGGMTGRADPLAGALGMNNDAQAAAITNVANVAERRPPMPASDAARMLDEARNRGLDLSVAEHPAGGFVLVPPNWVTPDMAAQGETRLAETIARMQQADGAPVERAPRTRTEPVDLSLPTDPVQNYVGNLRQVNTPAAQAFVRDFDAGRITPADVQQRMQAEQSMTPEQRIARAAAEAPAQADPVAERLRQAVSQSATSAPTDILNPSGLPFKTKMAANLAAKKTPGDVVPVEGGFVVRPQEPVNVQDVPQAPEVPQAAPAVSQPGQAPQAVGAQPAGPAAGVPTEGAGAVEAVGLEGDTAPTWPTMTPEQRRRSTLEREIATGMTNNGGVMAKLRPSAIEKRKQELAAMPPKEAAGAAPNSGVAAPAQETTYNGTRIYPTKVKVGDEVKSMWAAESPDNQRRRAAGERTIGGDSLHDTLEQAQAAAEREAKRDAERQAAKAEQDAADKARLDAEEARKAANRPKTVVERRKDAILDGPSKIGQGTKRAVITSAVDNGYAIEAKMVYDYAAKKRDQETVDRASRAGYILGVSNENLPLVKAGNEAKARLKEGKYEKPEYRVYQGSDTKAPFREITKTEYDYAQELKAQRAVAPQAEAAPAAASQQVAEPAATQDADVQPSPQDFIPAPDGGLDYGEITPEMGKAMRRQAGKIRLQHGVQNSNSTGWGLVHIEANHGKQISGLGFGSVQDFVAHVASSIQQVWQVPGNSQLLLTLKDGRKDVMYIQLEIAKEGDFYRVNSAFPVRQEDYESLKGMKKIWDGSEPTSAVTGQRPAFATAASASPESESSQGSSNARGQDASVPPTAPAAQPDTPKLTPAEAKSLMAWEDLGQKDGVKTHALTFYESQADKDAKRGRMIVAKVSKGDRSATAWMVDGEDKTFGMLAQAKKLAEEVGMAKAVADGYVEEGDAPANDRNVFTLKRMNQVTGKMEPVTFERGEYVRHKLGHGEIDGISQARSEFSVDGLWQPFGFAYKAERPAAPERKDVAPLSKVIDKMNAKHGAGLTDADRVPAPSTTPKTDAHAATMQAVRDGKATPERFQESFDAVVANADAIKAELSTKTKAELLRVGGPFVQMRYANEKKADVVDAVYREMVGEYALGESVTYGMGRDSYQNAVRKLVEATDADKLAQYVNDRQDEIAEAQARGKARAAALENPKTRDDFRNLLDAHMRTGKTRKESFLMLTPDQRIKYDTLEAEGTREARENRKRAQKTEVRAAGQTTAGEIIATKHTRDGYDLFVVKLADRLSADDYKTVLASAKKLGGWYSAFRGNGAIPGFQFKDKANAEAFLALAGGDTTAAQEQVAQRRDAFEDDRSQTAVERLRAMADKLEEGAAEVEGQQRKTNTERRARFASAALQAAAADKAKAQTMRNIAQAIEDGNAKFLDEVRTKSQVDMLTGTVDAAKGAELRAKYPNYADQEKRKGEPPTAETADFADFPSYSAFRSDLATLGRQMLEVDGTKKLGQRLLSVADDVTDAYLDFARANFRDVSQFGRGDALAEFASKDEAERAIKRSGLTGKAIVLPIKRGQNRVILSPSEAIGRGLWQGDGDKRITLTAEFGAELVEAIGRRGNKQNQLSVPWQFQTAYDRRKALSRIGIETPSEFRAALREFIDLKEQAVANRTRAMELQMVGRKADGMDFFPTSAEVADQMIEAADLSPDMAVLEPSAGMGHLADRIREAGAEPDVIEISADRRELLEEKGYTTQAVDDFLDLKPRGFFTFGDTFRAPDGAEGIMRGANGNRVRLVSAAGDAVGAGYYDRAELTGIAHNGTASGYDRIIMNPPFSNRRDAEHVRHAYSLLKPGGRIVAIMGEGVFFGQDKKAQEFREWLESVGGTSEKLPEGSFMDPSLPVNTSVNARMVVIDKPADTTALFRTPAMGGLFGRSVPHESVERTVQSILKGIPNAPQIEVHRTPADAGLSIPGPMPKGGVLPDGRIVVFSDANTGVLDVMRTVFHELFHRGLKSYFTSNADYVKFMLDMAAKWPVLRDGASQWKKSDDGQEKRADFTKNGPMTGDQLANYEALAVEESFATLSETLRAGSPLQVRTWTRAIGNMLERIARLFGMDKLGDWIHGLNNSELDDFVNAMIARSGNAPVPGSSAIINRYRTTDAAKAVGGTRTNFAGLAATARKELNRTFGAPGKLSWWHKTIGTMNNLAERSPAFKKVFDAAQGFIDDVSYYANDAAELAPKLLPKLETWRDIAKRPISAEDNTAIAKPINEGTLIWTRDEAGKPVKLQEVEDAAAKMTAEQKAQQLLRQDKISEGMLKAWQGLPVEQYEKLVASRYESQMLQPGIVWTPAELKSVFGLNDAQVSLYQEFRAATDRSLDTMARADMLRYGGKDVAELRDMVMDAPDAQEAASILREHLMLLAKENPDRADSIGQLANGMLDRAAKVKDLQGKGYAPLSRFGKYTVDVVDADGERQYFSLFDTQREANMMTEKLRAEFGDEAVTQGTLSDEEFKLLAGITPESLELFGNMLGLESDGDQAKDQAFQEYLRRTKTNRSAMRRLIHRKGIAGYSDDVGRVLASFVYSNARQTAAGLHMGDLSEAVADIPKQQGEMKDHAIRLAEYVKNPQEEAQGIRGLLFAQFLGGSIASVVVNMSQPVAVTFPWLSQYGGAKQAAAELGRAAKNMASRDFKYEDDLAAALKQAEEDGTVSPQEVHLLMAQARGSGSLQTGDGTRAGDARAAASNGLTRLSLAWGKLFGAAEQVNRRMTYIAAFRVAKAQKMADPAAFAKKAVQETQFIYSKANKMRWGRGAVGGVVMTFKTYSIAYLELLSRMWTQGGPEGKKAVLLALAMLLLMGGAGGLPFAEDAEDLVDGLAQMAGYNFNSKKAKQEFLEEVFGQAGAGFIERGITGLPGMPLDVSGRLGMGNLLPATGIFKEKMDHTRDVLELVGPVGDLAKRFFSGGRSILTGHVGAGLLEMSPVAVRNAAKGADMAATDMYRDAKGYKILDTTPTEAAMKAIGFQPASVAKVQESNFINQQAKNFYNMKAQEIRAKWARGLFERDPEIVAEARADLERWNRNNPEQRISANMPVILKRVREMNKSKDQRIADTAPKAMRQQMREEAAKERAMAG